MWNIEAKTWSFNRLVNERIRGVPDDLAYLKEKLLEDLSYVSDSNMVPHCKNANHPSFVLISIWVCYGTVHMCVAVCIGLFVGTIE